MNWRLHPRELAFVLGDANPRVVVTTAEFAATVAQLSEVEGATIFVTGGGGANDWEAWRNAQPVQPAAVVSYADDDVVLYDAEFSDACMRSDYRMRIDAGGWGNRCGWIDSHSLV